MGYDIVTVGALLCEVMRKELDRSRWMAADFTIHIQAVIHLL